MTTEPEVFVVTDVQSGTTTSQKNRQRTYLIGMSMRTICFIGAVVAHGTLRWILVAGAILLPYFAVVVANAGRERGQVRMTSLFGGNNYKAINSFDSTDK